MLKRIVAILILCSICVVSFQPIGGEYQGDAVSDDTREKVVFEGLAVGKSESYEEMAEKINEECEDEATKLFIEVVSDFEGLEKPTGDITLEAAKAIQKEQRRLLKEYHTRNNQQMAESLKLSDMNVTYECDSYAPYISAEFKGEITKDDMNDIYEMAESDVVKKIYVKSESEGGNELTDAVKEIDATTILNSNKNAGSGIVIGILEAKGVVDTGNANLSGADITVRDDLLYADPVSDHATMVASVAHAVAPGASILSAKYNGMIDNEIKWMINNGADIINMSLYDDTEEYFGTYTSSSAYCDYMVRNSWVTIICSAGNEGDDTCLVTPPNGYNNVTVGACNVFGHSVCGFSSYKEKYNINFPNIVAPGIGYKIPTFDGTHSGTSFSAPLVAGSVAVLMQKDSKLLTCPESILSILMASAERIQEYTSRSGFDDKSGAGMMNLQRAMNTIGNTVRFSMSSDSVGSYVSSKTIYVAAGQRIRVAFASIVNNKFSQTMDLVTDYDLYLHDGSGNRVALCTGTHNNEFIDYYATSSGYYTIKIKQFSAKKTTMVDYCSYSYYIE